MLRIHNPSPNLYDEMLLADGSSRAHYSPFWQWLKQTDEKHIQHKREEADLLFHRVGITFNVYGEQDGAERLIPFDNVPRIIPASEWQTLDRGIRQRVTALNAFLHDIYHEQHILKAKVIPAEQVLANDQYQPCMQGVTLHRRIYAHSCQQRIRITAVQADQLGDSGERASSDKESRAVHFCYEMPSDCCEMPSH